MVTLKVVRIALHQAVRYGRRVIKRGVTGDTAARVLGDIDRTLQYLGLEHWVTMEEFANAAVRVGLSRQTGIEVYHIMSALI